MLTMDTMSIEIGEQSPWTVLFADDSVICSEISQYVKESLGSWRTPWGEPRFSGSKTEYIWVDGEVRGGMLRFQRVKVMSIDTWGSVFKEKENVKKGGRGEQRQRGVDGKRYRE